MEEVLDLSVLFLTVAGIVGVAIWFCCSIVESIVKTRRRLKDSRYDALSQENERLKDFLTKVEEENSRLREIHHSERLRESKARPNAA